MGNNTSAALQHDDMAELVGGDILSLITCGMYSTPLAIYREYLQNAVDSLASSKTPEDGRVDIWIDLGKKRVTIRDNGHGLSHTQAQRELLPVSRSSKTRQRDRGFRGIGRLSGLAFGTSVTFLTRRSAGAPVTQVVWNGEQLRDGIDAGLSVEEIIRQCVTIEKSGKGDYPAHFFEVRVEGISRHAISSILNRDAVREYLGEVCPVPFAGNFPYTAQIAKMFAGNTPLFALNVYIEGEQQPIARPHGDKILASGGRMDEFVEFEEIRVPALADGGLAAVGWLAHSSYHGALPKVPCVRCIRVRAGNIQIGDEAVFDHLFSEIRFNRWCVGEIHVLDPRIVPNARRDYFEPGTHLRNLEHHIGPVCRSLEKRCREASRGRNQQRRYRFFLDDLESTHELVAPRYLVATEAREFIGEKLSELDNFREKHAALLSEEELRRLGRLERRLKDYSPPRHRLSFPGVAREELKVYRKIFRILADISPSPREAKKTIEAILKRAS